MNDLDSAHNLPALAAVVDLGAQCALLAVGRPDPRGGLELIEDHALHPRLGEGLEEGGALLPEAVERTLEVLVTYARRMDLCGVPPAARHVLCTSPLRTARDRDAFLARVQTLTGVRARVLSSAEEASLGWRGAMGSASRRGELCATATPRFAIDVGGGSTERVGPAPTDSVSVPMGAVGATELWIGLRGRAPRLLGGWPALVAGVRAAFERESAFNTPLPDGSQCRLLGGSAANLAAILGGLESFDPRLVDGVEIRADVAADWAVRLFGMPFEDQLDLPIEPARAPVLAAGLQCLAEALGRVGGAASVSARVSARGLRHGALAQILRLE